MEAEIKAIPKLDVIKEEEIHHLLLPGEMGAVLEWTVSDPKTGKVTEHKVIKSQSFVQGFLQLLYVSMAQSPTTAPIVITDTGAGAGVARNVSEYKGLGYHFRMNGLAASVTTGIIIGTGVTAATISDHRIETIIPHATMNYSAVTFGAPASDATTSQMTVTRNFANVSGGIVTVNEIGLYAEGTDNAGTQRFFMIIHDSGAGGLAIAVGIGQTLTVNYWLQATV